MLGGQQQQQQQQNNSKQQAAATNFHYLFVCLLFLLTADIYLYLRMSVC